MIEVYQAEWCPYSHRLRKRLTELGIDYVARQVEPHAPERDRLRAATGQDEIPAVVLEDGTVLAGATDEVIEALEERFDGWRWERGHVDQERAHAA